MKPSSVWALLVLAALAACSERRVMQPVRIVTGSWAPYVTESPQGGAGGIMTQIVTATLREAGYSPAYTLMPWPRAEQAVLESDQNSGFRGSFPWLRTVARERDYYFSQPLDSVDLVLFYNSRKTAGLSDIESFEELAEKPTLLPETERTYQFPDALLAVLENTVRTGESELRAFERLLDVEDRGAILVPAVREVGRALVRDAFPSQVQHIDFVRAEGTRFRISLHFIASRRNPHNRRLIEEFDEALARLRREGRLPQVEATISSAQTQQQTVLLTSPDNTGFVTATTRPGSARRIRLPRGTRALVLEWSAAFLDDTSTLANHCRIEILNGPLRGRILYVEDRFIELP